MFGTFKFDEKTKLSDANDGIDSRSYTRTACDFCRLKKLRCSGEMKSCERCRATSTPCTYTLSSGTGKSKKRVRRQPFSDSAVGCFPVEPKRNDDLNPARQRGDRINQEPSQSPATRKPESSKYSTTVPSMQPESGNSSAISTVDSVQWPNPGPDLSGILSFSDDCDLLGMDDGLDMSEDNSRLWDTSPLQSRGYLSGQSDATHTHLGEKPKANRDSPGLRPDRLLTNREPVFTSTTNESRDHAGSDSMSASLTSLSTCGCLANVARLFETVCSRTSSDQRQSIDVLLIDLEDGIAGCKGVLVCGECTACSDNPTLVATVGSHLVDLWDTITQRVMMCQRRNRIDSASNGPFEEQGDTQTFRFGCYAIQSPEMNCFLLNNLVQLHYNNLNELLSYLRIPVRQKPSALEIVEQAVTKAARITWAMRREVAEARMLDV